MIYVRFFIFLTFVFVGHSVFAVEPQLYTDPIPGSNKYWVYSQSETQYYRDSFDEAIKARPNWGDRYICSWVYSAYNQGAIGSVYFGLPSNQSCSLVLSAGVKPGACPSGSTFENSTAKCKLNVPSCPSDYVYNSTENTCDYRPLCSSIGFNTGAIYPSGYCVEDINGNPSSSSASLCYENEQEYNVPPCALVPCPDGSYIDVNLGQTCPVPKQCHDGSIVYGSAQCPPPPFICPDGSEVLVQSQCSSPTDQDKLCSDGSKVPLSADCPTDTNTAHCADGSTVPSISQCPPHSHNGFYQCADGSISQEPGNCPVLQTSDSNISDKSTSTSQTTDNGDGTTTTVTETELNLDAVNSRLDQLKKAVQDQDIDGVKQAINDLNIDGIIDAINNKEFDTGNIENLLNQIKNINENSKNLLSDMKDLFNEDSTKEPEEEDEQSAIDSLMSFFGDRLNDLFSGQSDALSDFINNSDNPFLEIELLDSSFWLPAFPSHTECTGSVDLSVFGRQILFEPCEKLAPLRDVLAWVFYVLFFIRIFNMMFTIHEVH